MRVMTPAQIAAEAKAPEAERGVPGPGGHLFGALTQRCDCGVAAIECADGGPTHAEALLALDRAAHPGLYTKAGKPRQRVRGNR